MPREYKFDEASRKHSRDKQRRRRERIASLPQAWTKEDRELTLTLFDHCCAVCMEPLEKTEWDHWVPVYDDNCPGHVIGNLVPLCPSCNRLKADTAAGETFDKNDVDRVNSVLRDLGATWM